MPRLPRRRSRGQEQGRPDSQWHHRPAAGTIDGYTYSEANKQAGAKGLVWTEEIMFKYLETPLTFMPGTKMAFAGLKDAQDRKDVIAYLKKFSK